MSVNRRNWLHSVGLGSLSSFWPLSSVAAARPAANIYQELGIRPVINCMVAWTVIGASKQWPELHAPMAEASSHFVFLEELQEKIGARLSKLIGSEAPMVTTGAAGAITLGTCASLTGDDQEKIRRLPDLTGMKSEVLIQKRHRNNFDHAVRNAGVKLIEVESKEQLLGAIGERTAMLYYLGNSDSGEIPLAECIAICKRAGVPVLVDAANLLPSWENIQKLTPMGVDLICISGGKHMRGPQCSGILAGRKELIRSALLNASPREDALGRPMKVGREEMIGVWLAAEKYSKLDFDMLNRQCEEQSNYLIRELKKIPGVDLSYTPDRKSHRVQRVLVQWDERKIGLSTDEFERKLLEGEPRIAALRHEPQGMTFVFFLGEPGNEKLVARRLKEIFMNQGMTGVRMTGVRMDKWLWAARFFKTRTLAARACELGRIEANGLRAKAAREVRVGDLLQVKNDGGDFQVEVLALSEMRGPAAVAQTLYRETEASRELRMKLAEERKASPHFEAARDGKPSKRDRRAIGRLRGRV